MAIPTPYELEKQVERADAEEKAKKLADEKRIAVDTITSDLFEAQRAKKWPVDYYTNSPDVVKHIEDTFTPRGWKVTSIRRKDLGDIAVMVGPSQSLYNT